MCLGTCTVYDDDFLAALRAHNAQKSVRQDAATQVATKLFFHIPRQRFDALFAHGVKIRFRAARARRDGARRSRARDAHSLPPLRRKALKRERPRRARGDILVEILRSEAIRVNQAPTGLLVGLTNPVTARALSAMHSDVAHDWTVSDLARLGVVSRSTFPALFRKSVGTGPIEYLLHWRMALARDELRRGAKSDRRDRSGDWL